MAATSGARGPRPDLPDPVSLFAKASGHVTGPLTVSLETQDGSRTFAAAEIDGLTHLAAVHHHAAGARQRRPIDQ
jgi:hypothetical protein